MDDLDEIMYALAADRRIYVGEDKDMESAKARYNKAIDKAIDTLKELQKRKEELTKKEMETWIG